MSHSPEQSIPPLPPAPDLQKPVSLSELFSLLDNFETTPTNTALHCPILPPLPKGPPRNKPLFRQDSPPKETTFRPSSCQRTVSDKCETNYGPVRVKDLLRLQVLQIHCTGMCLNSLGPVLEPNWQGTELQLSGGCAFTC